MANYTAVAVVIIVLLSILFLFGYFLRRKSLRRKRIAELIATAAAPAAAMNDGGVHMQQNAPPAIPMEIIGSSHVGPRSFNYDQLSVATKGFSSTELLGKGGFGFVYKGVLDDGTLAAVKRITANSDQGLSEFRAEVRIISDLRHRHLVRLKGWCHDQGQLLLVYDYMPNGSLDYLLFNDDLCEKLTWKRRYDIGVDLGSALTYLHNECDNVIIHRDVKSSNVLLDENFHAKLGDFGLSRQVDREKTSYSTLVAGTRGYMAPEFFYGSGKATTETDVYAFGVVLLELVTGKRAFDPASFPEYDGMLLHWVWALFKQDKVTEAIDHRMNGVYDVGETRRMLMIGLACSIPNYKERPKIKTAVEVLLGNVALPVVPPVMPTAYFGPVPGMNVNEILRDLSQNSTIQSGTSGTTNTTASSSTLLSASSSDHGATPMMYGNT